MVKLTISEQKEFIKDYYNGLSYDAILIKYRLNREQADNLWEQFMKKVI